MAAPVQSTTRPVNLSGRALVRATGEDAEKFLQAIITTDLDDLGKGEMKPGALLTPQGKIMFDFLVSRVEGGLLFDLAASHAADFAKRLTLYRLRSKAEISLQNESFVSVSWGNDSVSSHDDSTVLDGRFPAEMKVLRHYGEIADATDEAEWAALRIAHGVAEGGCDFTLGNVFPHDVNLDQTGGVSFRKGCFIGQEVVSRMQHRGTARRRVLIATGGADLPATGTPLTSGGREIGTLGSVSGNKALALVRIDRVKDAMVSGTPILVGDVAVVLAIPPAARFGFPEQASENA
ncbi:folate-binding protein YgfZ [Phyllobacterium phragmitis]|uniref:Folate-binding protein YgfZ n=1 Tax=Phyllobacterium phragmitis TaxID=2670329 RepID=A0A2S9IZB8_9HYPH|nr:folate-binding protein YgfZ [Phyllobacterium phragmitis]PRD45869.1 folate-binding protein YgfZ [Phyllobacterium phragmitis]